LAFISIENVSKTYSATESESSVQVLTDIQAEIQEGEFIALMGPSGSGKSTLLTIIGAMNHPTSGKVFIDGIDIYSLSDERRADFSMEYLGFVFQQHHLMPYLTALENAMLPLATPSISTQEKCERAMDVLNRVSLGKKASRLPNQLSGGRSGQACHRKSTGQRTATAACRRADGNARQQDWERNHGSLFAAQSPGSDDFHGHSQPGKRTSGGSCT
jgi:putative ABC transport system ATP-binding protein